MLTGILTVSQGVSRVNGIPLAICGNADPFGSATNFLAGQGFGNGSAVVVTGASGSVGNTPVLCMTGVQAAAGVVANLTNAVAASGSGSKPSAKGGKKKAAAKKPKAPAKKMAKKKTVAKKTKTATKAVKKKTAKTAKKKR